MYQSRKDIKKRLCLFVFVSDSRVDVNSTLQAKEICTPLKCYAKIIGLKNVMKTTPEHVPTLNVNLKAIGLYLMLLEVKIAQLEMITAENLQNWNNSFLMALI